jgi:hypothetical protein
MGFAVGLSRLLFDSLMYFLRVVSCGYYGVSAGSSSSTYISSSLLSFSINL